MVVYADLTDEQRDFVRLLFSSSLIRQIEDPALRVTRVYNALVVMDPDNRAFCYVDLWKSLEEIDLEVSSSPLEELIVVPRGMNFRKDWQAWVIAALSLIVAAMFALMKCGLSMCMG